MGWLALGLVAWALGWWINSHLSHQPRTSTTRLLVPVIFGLTVVVIWECLVRGLSISPVLLPAPTAIAATFAKSTHILWSDFVQTALKGALTGYIMGCGAAFLGRRQAVHQLGDARALWLAASRPERSGAASSRLRRTAGSRLCGRAFHDQKRTRQ